MIFKNVNPDLILRTYRKSNLNESDNNMTVKEKWISTIEGINDGDEKIISKIILHFKNLGNFISTMSKMGLIDYFDPFSNNLDEYQNEVFYAFYEQDNSFIWKIIDNYLSDVTKIDNDYYLDVTDFEDLSELFNYYRGDISQSAIEEILSGEYEMNYWGNVTDDEFRDVYQELTPEKKELVNNRIREEIKDETFEVTHHTPALFDEIAEKQGTESEIIITDEVITDLLEDEESIEYIISNKVDDIKSDLYMIYEGCYRDTLVDEWYNDFWDGLVGFAIDDKTPTWGTYQRETWDKEGKRVTKTYDVRKYKVTNCLRDVAVEFLTVNKEKTYSDNTFEYWGNYMGILKALINDGDRSHVSTPRLDDWPDSNKVSKCVNENIGDYF